LEVAVERLRQDQLVADLVAGRPLRGWRAVRRGGRSCGARTEWRGVWRVNPVKVAGGSVVRLRLDRGSGSYGKHSGKAAEETGIHGEENLRKRTKKHL